MSTEGGPKIIRADLDTVLDASSQRQSLDAKDTNILDYSTWTVGETSATGFGRNGGADENIIITGTGPWGESAVIWEARPNGAGGADGGWNTSQFSIDNTKLYRFSVWVRRTVFDNGRFYFGTRGYGSTSGVLFRDTGSSSTNPYAYVSGDPPSTSQLPSNTWLLVVFHVWPVGSGTGSNHADSGRYTVSGGRFGDISRDFVWINETTTALHRTYLYYAEATTPRQQWLYPRVDIVDGTEPSIEELLDGGRRGVVNLADRTQKFYLPNKVRRVAASNIGRSKVKKFSFDATDDYIKITGGTHTSLQRTIEVIFRVNSVPATYTPIATYTRASGGTESYKRIWLGIQSNKFQMHGWGTTDPSSTTTVTNGDYYHCVYAYNQSNKNHYIWVNGTLEHNSTNSQDGMTGWTNSSDLNWWVGRDPQAAGWTGGAGEYFNGDIAVFKTYSKILSTSEVQRNYRAYKNRFDL